MWAKKKDKIKKFFSDLNDTFIKCFRVPRTTENIERRTQYINNGLEVNNEVNLNNTLTTISDNPSIRQENQNNYKVPANETPSYSSPPPSYEDVIKNNKYLFPK